jgi:amidase
VRTVRVEGVSTGSLAGTAFVAKDLYDVSGQATGAGNPDWERTHAVPTRTAPVIERLPSAGATLVGKSCTDELAFSLDGINIHYGMPLNPRFPDRLPGGSSSGSVSAVAAGLADLALGTDTSGSIRVPASYCGVDGYRPTHGVIPIDGVVPLSPSFDTVGWLARDARTLARCGRVVLGADTDRARSRTIAGFARIHLLTEAFELVDERYRGGIRDVTATLSRPFAETRELQLPNVGLTGWIDVFHAIKQWEAWQAHGKWVRATNPNFADSIRANFAAASRVTDAEHGRALADRTRLRASMLRDLTHDSVICLPTAWTIAPLKQASACDRSFVDCRGR